MPWFRIALLLAFLPLESPDLLREPDYAVVRHGDRWILQKPGVGGRQPFTISEHTDRGAAELRRRSLPRLRLESLFVRFDPASGLRTPIADWTDRNDAQEISADIREVVDRFAPRGTLARLQATPVFMARLFGATGHTAEEPDDFTRFVILLDPFRATGRLHAASTLIHELTHVERYRARGFHANRAAAAMPKRDFVLLGLADEFAAFHAEANLVRSFLDGRAKQEVRQAIAAAIRDPELRWPLALTVMLGFEGPSDEVRRLGEVRRHVVLDLARNAGAYWEARHNDILDPVLRHTIRDWYEDSREWREIRSERAEWNKAEAAAN
jgi:hypothetical protein